MTLMNDFTDLSEAEQREAVEDWTDERFSDLRRGNLSCLVCRATAAEFLDGDARKPYCGPHLYEKEHPSLGDYDGSGR